MAALERRTEIVCEGTRDLTLGNFHLDCHLSLTALYFVRARKSRLHVVIFDFDYEEMGKDCFNY